MCGLDADTARVPCVCPCCLQLGGGCRSLREDTPRGRTAAPRADHPSCPRELRACGQEPGNKDEAGSLLVRPISKFLIFIMRIFPATLASIMPPQKSCSLYSQSGKS